MNDASAVSIFWSSVRSSTARMRCSTSRRKLRPSTAQKRRMRRVVGASRSIWVLIAACTDSGSCTMEPDPTASRVTSSTKSGFPSARSTMAATSCGRSGVASVAAWTRCSITSRGSGLQVHANTGPRGETTCLASPYDDDRPGSAVRGEREPVEECDRRTIRPVGLLDDDDERARNDTPDHVDDEVSRPVGAELRVDPVGLRRRGHLDLDHVRQQRGHGQQVGRPTLQAGEERTPHDLRLGAGHLEQGP